MSTVEEAPAEGLTPAQACQALNLSPHTFRRLLQEFHDVLPGPLDENGTLSPDHLRRLALIARMRAEGADGATIRAALLAGGEMPAAGVEPGSSVQHPPVWTAALERLDRLEEAVRALDRRSREDRDRMMVMLARLHQELQMLRWELASRGGRRLP